MSLWWEIISREAVLYLFIYLFIMTGDANAFRFIFIDLKFCPERFNIPDTSIKTSLLFSLLCWFTSSGNR